MDGGSIPPISTIGRYRTAEFAPRVPTKNGPFRPVGKGAVLVVGASYLAEPLAEPVVLPLGS